MFDWQNLLTRFLRNETSEKEKKLVIRALHDGWADNDFLAAIESVMEEPITEEYSDRKEVISEMLLHHIHSQPVAKENKQSIINQLISGKWFRIAALFILFFSIGYFVRLHTSGQEWKKQPVFHTLSVPAGQTVNLTLSDGTVVWLNSRSVMRYPDHFDNKQREVYLEGEAFFEVAHRQGSSFTVHTHDYDILALGTQFDVEAYPGDFTTALIQGSVEIKSKDNAAPDLLLQPNNIARLTGGKLITEPISDLNYYRWREGLICVKDITFDDLMKKFEKCYDVRILLQNQRIKKDVYTGKFRYSDGIDHALRVLRRDVRFSFTRDEETQIIVIK
jgi:ferric-dicitrate binding protein FerR (iron transport regulator)